jgi:hypothetical protein
LHKGDIAHSSWKEELYGTKRKKTKTIMEELEFVAPMDTIPSIKN